MKSCLLFAVILLLFTSCGTLDVITIKVQKPAQVTLPLSIRNIVIVNNSPQQPADVGHTEKKWKQEKDVAVTSDSLNTILIQALAQFLDDERYFDSVSAYDTPLGEDAIFPSESLIDEAKVNKIKTETGADAIVSLDRLILKSNLDKTNIGNNLTDEFLCVQMNVNFRVYQTGKMPLLPVMSLQDTLCWEALSQNGRYFDFVLISREKALKEAVLTVADKMVYMFIPYWQEQNRWYYTDGSTPMKKASAKASANHWKDAAIVWGDIYESEKSTNKKAKVASNIALANEMLDDLENAQTWLNIADELFAVKQNEKSRDRILINEYKEELKQRTIDSKKLDIQQRTPTLEVNE